MEFSIKIQKMVTDIEKCISKYFKGFIRYIVFFGNVYLNLGIWCFYPGMWQTLQYIRRLYKDGNQENSEGLDFFQ